MCNYLASVLLWNDWAWLAKKTDAQTKCVDSYVFARARVGNGGACRWRTVHVDFDFLFRHAFCLCLCSTTRFLSVSHFEKNPLNEWSWDTRGRSRSLFVTYSKSLFLPFQCFCSGASRLDLTLLQVDMRVSFGVCYLNIMIIVHN